MLCPLSDPAEMLFLVMSRTLIHIMKVSARKKSNKKGIAKTPLTNLYEMNSRSSSRIMNKCHNFLDLIIKHLFIQTAAYRSTDLLRQQHIPTNRSRLLFRSINDRSNCT